MAETNDDRVLAILSEAKLLAQEYRVLTGKPLGITCEVAEYEAARILGVELSSARNPGYDANERGQLAIAKFRSIGRERWRRPLQPVVIPADAGEVR